VNNSATIAPAEVATEHPTIWGLTPVQLHDRYWASRGIQVVRRGEPSDIVEGANLFLLTDPRSLTLFRINQFLDDLNWLKPQILFMRLSDSRERGYREMVSVDAHGTFLKFHRTYLGADSRLTRFALTEDAQLARLWQQASDPRNAWRQFRRLIPPAFRATTSGIGRVYDRSVDQEVAQFVRTLVRIWQRPDTTIRRINKLKSNVWTDQNAEVGANSRFSGAAWIGAGRVLKPQTGVIGPTVLWDLPSARPTIETLRWDDIEPTQALMRPVQVKSRNSISKAAKRTFDIVFAVIALLCTLPIYPLIMLAIWLEDGRPFFFGHRRETLGGREFPCLKFRSMRKDAEKIKLQLKAKNQADGPQFYIERDPRLTKVGAVIRKYNLDELPQFINVLIGDMSVVGPRPSPHAENQFCPPWREARLSVRPGITGLWQINRTRRAGTDFQEWIKYDLEYVEHLSFWMDMKIIAKTIEFLVRGSVKNEH